MSSAKGFRVVIALDLDAFYASALLQLPSNAHLANCPVGVVQKHLVVTTNYIARARGVQKMSTVSSALSTCPDIALIDGSDLAPFREAARRVRKSVRDHFTESIPIEYLGLDEMFLDITAVVSNLLRAGKSTRPWSFQGHVFGAVADDPDEPEVSALILRSLQLGSQIAADVRAAVRSSTGFAVCAGIASTKLGAKIAAGMRKPNDQCVVLNNAFIAEHLASKAPSAIPGFGRGYTVRLAAWADDEVGCRRVRPNIETVKGLLVSFATRPCALASVIDVTEERAKWILMACRGFDDTPVKRSGAPSSISSEDSMKSCTDASDVKRRILEISRKLVWRLVDDCEEHGVRHPSALTVKFRFAGLGWKYSTRTVSMPRTVYQVALNGRDDLSVLEHSAQAIAQAASSVLFNEENMHRDRPFCLTLLGVGAGHFRTNGKRGTNAMHSRLADLRHWPSIKSEGEDSRKVERFSVETSERQVMTQEAADFGVKKSGIQSQSKTICPVCDQALHPATSNDMLNRHIDRCLGNRSTKRSRHLTTQNTLRVDSFFKPA
jgi:DNA polymerase iota